MDHRRTSVARGSRGRAVGRSRRSFASLAALAACTVDAGRQPEIDDLDSPSSVALGPDGNYHVDRTITYHDPQGRKIVEARVSFGNGSGVDDTLTTSIPDDDQAARLRGELDYRVVVVNATGDASEPASKHVTLE